jgi:hypothetical protein
MVRGERRKETHSRDAEVKRQYGSYSIPPLLRVASAEGEIEDDRAIDHYLLHHLRSDRVTQPSQERYLFN